MVLPLTDREVLALKGPDLTAEDREILAAFAAQLATVLESNRLHAEAAEADSLARANQLRSALLAAVSHDLRTPLASIKAASSSLLSDQLTFGPDESQDPPADDRRRGRPAQQPGGEPAGHGTAPDRLGGRARHERRCA